MREYKITLYTKSGTQSSSVSHDELQNLNNLTGILSTQHGSDLITKQRYFDLRNFAWKILIDSGINSLPVDLNLVACTIGCAMWSYVKDAEAVAIIDREGMRFEDEGFSVELEQGQGIICYAETNNPSRQRFTIAHELAHVALRQNEGIVRDFEKEANMLARRLLVPMGILDACRVSSAEEISELCGVSHQAADYSFNRYQMLIKRGKFNTSPLERKLIAQFKSFIDNYLKHKL